MAIKKHIHRLKRKSYKNGTKMYFCTLPDCYFKVEVDTSLGKESLCNICGEPFIMNEYTLRLKSPHCERCGRREVKNNDGTKRYVRKIGNRILDNVADKVVDDLTNRLHQLTAASPEEDI